MTRRSPGTLPLSDGSAPDGPASMDRPVPLQRPSTGPAHHQGMDRHQPLTRESLFAMMQAYKQTSLLRTGVELGVFAALGAPATAAAVAGDIGADERGTRILLDALAALGLVGVEGGTYRLTPDAAPLLLPSSPDYQGDMVKVIASDAEWDALKRLTEAVRKGGTVMDEHAETPMFSYWEVFAEHAPAIARPTASILVRSLEDWARGLPRLDVLDVACGHGVYGTSVAHHFPTATLTCLDWPNVLPYARRQAERVGVEDRLALIGGDMFEQPWQGPYDLVLITNVLHHFPVERATELLARARSALRPGGRLGLVGFTTTDAPPAEDAAAHLFAVLMLAWTEGGEVHSERTYAQMLDAARFTDVHRAAVPGLPFRVLTATAC